MTTRRRRLKKKNRITKHIRGGVFNDILFPDDAGKKVGNALDNVFGEKKKPYGIGDETGIELKEMKPKLQKKKLVPTSGPIPNNQFGFYNEPVASAVAKTDSALDKENIQLTISEPDTLNETLLKTNIQTTGNALRNVSNALNENPSSENSSNENSSGENSSNENPSSENSSSENPSSENSSGENSSSENPSSENLSSENSSGENPSSENPSSENSSVVNPSNENSSGENSADVILLEKRAKAKPVLTNVNANIKTILPDVKGRPKLKQQLTQYEMYTSMLLKQFDKTVTGGVRQMLKQIKERVRTTIKNRQDKQLNVGLDDAMRAIENDILDHGFLTFKPIKPHSIHKVYTYDTYKDFEKELTKFRDATGRNINDILNYFNENKAKYEKYKRENSPDENTQPVVNRQFGEDNEPDENIQAEKHTDTQQKPRNYTFKNIFSKKSDTQSIKIAEQFDSSIAGELPIDIEYNDTIPSSQITITLDGNGLKINDTSIENKDTWNSARESFLGITGAMDEIPNLDDFKFPNGKLRIVIDIQQKKMAVYINESTTPIRISNQRELEELAKGLDVKLNTKPTSWKDKLLFR